MKPVLVLRPEPAAGATVEQARQRGLDAIAIPLFELEAVVWQLPEAASFDALLLTSANAVRCGGDGLGQVRGLPVHAVGKATAQAARDAGFDIANIGDGGVDRLLGSLAPELRLLHLCGEDRRAPTDGHLQAITSVVVYRSIPRTGIDLSGAGGSVVLIHSPRAGERFATLVDQAGIRRSEIVIAAISSVAAAATGEGWATVEFAENPDDDALLALAERLCNKCGGQ